MEQELLKLIENKGSQSWHQLALRANELLGTNFHGESLRDKYRRSLQHKKHLMKSIKDQVAGDIESSHTKHDSTELTKKYKKALETIDNLQTTLDSFRAVKPISTYRIEPQKKSGTNEAVAVVLASDQHIEERVRPEDVNQKNEYNLSISKQRQEEFFRGALRLTEVCGKDVQINTMVFALLGDFITNDIHEEFPEITELPPVKAVIECQNRLASGIEFLLKNSKLNLVIPCHSGNHARTTEKTRNATEAGHSLEYFMYHQLANHFRGEKRVKFLISESYHSYLEVLGLTIRFHHGHNIRYGGGIGGLTIPVNKAIAQWNKLRWADLDCFGHFHQRIDGGNFLANGSLIGFNAFALSIKAGFEEPSQTFFLVDKKRGRTCVWPILFKQNPACRN